MGRNLAAGLLITACIFMLVSFRQVSADEEGYSFGSVELVVYQDGMVHVTQALTVNETFSSISLGLLAPSIENVIIVDENNTVLNYEISGSNMTVFTLGAKSVLVEYDTDSLTQKEAGVWTLILDVPCNLTVYLPEASTIVYLNDVPTSMSTVDGKIALSLFPEKWEISYVMPTSPSEAFIVSDLSVSPTSVEVGKEVTISAKVANIGDVTGSYTVVLKINDVIENNKTVTLAKGVSETVEFKVIKQDAGTYNVEVSGLNSTFTVEATPPPPIATSSLPLEYIIGAVVLVAIGGGFALLKRNKFKAEKLLKAHFDLRQEDKEVIQFIDERGGKVLEAELRERFQELPRTSLWRLVKRLEKMELISVKKIGLQNQIELRK
jgi:uncharacterized membrane protein